MSRLVTDENLNDLRKLADALLNWVRKEIGDPNKHWVCVGNEDELDRVISERIIYVRGSYLDDEAYDNIFTRLVQSLKSQSKLSEDKIAEELDESLNQFVKDCCKRPGPERSVDSGGRSSIAWRIIFDEESIMKQSLELAKSLSIGFADRSVKVRANCSGFRFEGTFAVDEFIWYEAGPNKFILKFDAKAVRSKIPSMAVQQLRPLSTLCKVLYGFDAGLGNVYVVYPYSRGGDVQKISQMSAQETGNDPHTFGPLPLRQAWKAWKENIDKADASGTLLAKMESLSNTRNIGETLLDLITCYEILLAGKTTEIAHKLLIRGSVLLSSLGTGGTYSTIAKAYDDRSNIIHGSALVERLGRARIEEANKNLARWLRQLILLRVLVGGQTDDFTKQADLLVRRQIDPSGLSGEENTDLAEFDKYIKLAKSLFVGESPQEAHRD